jgi:hypothetical protein
MEEQYTKLVKFIEIKYGHMFSTFEIVNERMYQIEKNAKCIKCNHVFTLDLRDKEIIPTSGWEKLFDFYYFFHKHGEFGEKINDEHYELHCDELIIKNIIE